VELIVWAALTAYGLGLLRIFVGLGMLARGQARARPSATVLVAARNEEKDVDACLQALSRQDYSGPFEVLVLNDGSTDQTALIVARHCQRDPRIKLLDIEPALDGTAPKKHALMTGLNASTSELVFVTDADCVVASGWMSGLAAHFADNVGLVTGAVFLPESKGLGAEMRNLDFASYIICGAGMLASGWPVIATAMNLAYRRTAFEEAGGFGKHAHVVSGDDDLLLHAIVGRTKWKAAFAHGPDTVVSTRPVDSLGAFLNQRMRWASKSFLYPPGMTLFLIGAFVLFAGILVGLPLAALGIVSWKTIAAVAAAKLLLDAMVIIRGYRAFSMAVPFRAFLPAEILHLPYVLVASVGGALGLFAWKGRKK
jgi:glycosyltransferase involved in cell wall biosynthesis